MIVRVGIQKASKEEILIEIYGEKKKKKYRPRGLEYKLIKKNPTTFKKGLVPWNKGKPGYHRSKKSKGYINTGGYLVFYVKGKEILAHRVLWEKYYGQIPEGHLVHHKDGNKLNNDISNLELVTRAEHATIHNFAEKMGRKR